MTTLIQASAKGYVDIVNILLKTKADPNIQRTWRDRVNACFN